MNAKPVLELVPAQSLPAPPYPADTRSGSYGFRLDNERIEQSTTWKLAALTPELRPWLLMLWRESWRQIPCGSLPDDDEEIAAIIGWAPTYFAAGRKILMRGWQRHSDGRLYHEVITGLVLSMLSERARFRQRQRKHRSQAVDPDSVTGMSRVTHGVSQAEGEVKGEVKATPKTKVKSLVSAQGSRLPDGWQLPEDWLAWAVGSAGMSDDAVQREALVFRDYWRSKAGAGARKVDWLATWRNWIRRMNR